MKLLLFLALLAGIPPVFAAEVLNVRLWPMPDRTRVEFELSSAPRYEVFSVSGPDRIVVDFTEARLKGALPPVAAATPLLAGLRHAPKGGGLRVVLDLKTAASVRTVLLKPAAGRGHRLMVELAQPEGRAATVTRNRSPARKAGPQTPAPMQARRPEASAGKPAAAAAAARTAVEASKPAAGAGAAASDDHDPIMSVVQGGFRDVVIAIDAGHGGVDPGAIGKNGTREKDITLAIARQLAALVNAEPGMKAVLIRDGDQFIPLRERMARARRHKADLFISVHADAFRDSSVRGSSVYVLSDRGASSEQARWLAERENAADLVGGVKLEDKDDMLKSVLLDLSQTAVLEASTHLARKVLGKLDAVGNVHRREVQRAGFMVLKSPDVPSILIETAFISNPQEEKKLRSPAHQRALAEAILEGIRSYFRTHAPEGTRLALRSHVIGRGETLASIAERYDVSPESLRLANDLADSRIEAGAVLAIP